MSGFKKFRALTVVFVVAIGALLAPQPAAAAVQATLYVSPSGSDSNPGTQALPLLTPQKAQEKVRTLNANMTGDIEVILAGGTYQLASTLTFTAADSGTNGYDIVYKAAAGSAPIISGGTPLTGWAVHDAAKNIYRSYLGTSVDTRQLYVNGVRATRAKGAANPGFVKTATGFTGPTTGLYATMDTWGNISNIEVVTKWTWVSHRLGVASASGSTLTMKAPGYTTARARNFFDNAAWIENAYELLDAAGEWYLNRTDGYVYYIPRAGENLSTATVIAAKLETLVKGNGTLDDPVHNVTLDGLTFAYNTWLHPNSNYSYSDAQAGVVYLDGTTHDQQLVTPGAVAFTTAHNVTIQNCTFTKGGSAGVSFALGSHDNVIDHNTFTDLSGSGVAISGVDPDTYHHPTDARMVVRDNTVSHNMITAIGVEYFDAVGIFAGYVNGLTISHNTITNVPYTGITVGWGWGQIDQLATTAAGNNTINHNLVYDFMKVLGDGGGIYTLGAMPGTTVNNNYLYADKSTNGAFIYHDNGSAGIYDTNNVVSKLNSSQNNWNSGGYTNSTFHLNTRQISAKYNYYTAGMVPRNFGGSNYQTHNYPVSNYAYDATAQSVIDNAGVDGGDGPAVIPEFSGQSFDGFEQGLVNWNRTHGASETLATTPVYAGTSSYELNEDLDGIVKGFSYSMNKVVSAWIYDDASQTNVTALGFVNDDLSVRGLGISTAASATKYVYRVNGVTTASSVARSTGWHKLTWDYRSGTRVDLYIDGTLVAAPTGLDSFNRVWLGDQWSSGIAGSAVKFDNVEIADTLDLPLAPGAFADGFENGLANWTTTLGAASTSTVKAHSGTSSYVTNQDQDAIQRIFPTSYNKVVSMWFYDDATAATMQAGAMVDDNVNLRGLLVAVAHPTKYSYRVGGTVTASTVTRTTGWHEFRWDYTSGTKVDMYIDGVLVASPTGATSVKRIQIGDLWGGNGNTYSTYFDDIAIH